MKTTDLLILGVAGVAIYYLFFRKGGVFDTGGGSVGGGGSTSGDTTKGGGDFPGYYEVGKGTTWLLIQKARIPPSAYSNPFITKPLTKEQAQTGTIMEKIVYLKTQGIQTLFAPPINPVTHRPDPQYYLKRQIILYQKSRGIYALFGSKRV